jgi:hypothetical protein
LIYSATLKADRVNDIGVFTPEQARTLWQDYQSRKQLTPQLTQNYPQRRQPVESYRRRPAVIGSTLTAPASSLVAATSCTVYFLELQSDGTQTLNETPYTAYNDDPEVAAVPGTYCRIEWLNGRWMIYYLGCDLQAALVAVLP